MSIMRNQPHAWMQLLKNCLVQHINFEEKRFLPPSLTSLKIFMIFLWIKVKEKSSVLTIDYVIPDINYTISFSFVFKFLMVNVTVSPQLCMLMPFSLHFFFQVPSPATCFLFNSLNLYSLPRLPFQSCVVVFFFLLTT